MLHCLDVSPFGSVFDIAKEKGVLVSLAHQVYSTDQQGPHWLM
jgi:hypothetical protein